MQKLLYKALILFLILIILVFFYNYQYFDQTSSDKTESLSFWKKITYEKICLEKKCDLSNKTYNQDYCYYQYIKNKSGNYNANQIHFYENALLYKDYIITRDKKWFWTIDCSKY